MTGKMLYIGKFFTPNENLEDVLTHLGYNASVRFTGNDGIEEYALQKSRNDPYDVVVIKDNPELYHQINPSEIEKSLRDMDKNVKIAVRKYDINFSSLLNAAFQAMNSTEK
ncbi:MAG: hypothetical protein WC755_00670 [Candidatus Woesearchaeota archaeon]|jgi:hypothetical protein